MIFDTHAHYDNEAFDRDREEILRLLGSVYIHEAADIGKQADGGKAADTGKRADGGETAGAEAGAVIGAVVNVGASLESTKRTLELVKTYPRVYGSAGVHPSESMELTEDGFRWLTEAAQQEKIVAVGEIGLDYYWKEPEVSVQKHWFVRQLDLAQKAGLPVIIHSRDAAKDMLDILKAEHGRDIGGVIHCFSYSREMAREYLEMGFYLGIGGVLTFQNARHLKEVVEYAPLDRLVLETDCPYLAPVPYRGKRNCSFYLPYVVRAMAEIKQCSPERIEAVTWDNAKALYRFASDFGK